MRCYLFCPALAWAGWRRGRARCAHVRTIGLTNVFACPLCGIQVERKGAPRRRRGRRGRGLLRMLILPRIFKGFDEVCPALSRCVLAPSGDIANETRIPTVCAKNAAMRKSRPGTTTNGSIVTWSLLFQGGSSVIQFVLAPRRLRALGYLRGAP